MYISCWAHKAAGLSTLFYIISGVAFANTYARKFELHLSFV